MVQDKRYASLTDWMRARATIVTEPLARFLGTLGFNPNTLTVLGFVLSAGVAVVIALGFTRLGGVLLLFASAMDALDGALARATQTESHFGAFLDSTLDRLSEGVLLFGLLAWMLRLGSLLDVSLIFVALLGSVMVSYTRARAEGVGYSCKVGIFTRVERVLVLGFGLIIGWLRITLILLAVFTWITVFQRVFHVYRQSRLESQMLGQNIDQN